LFQKSNGTPTKDPKGIKRHFSRAELHLQNQKLDRKIRVKTRKMDEHGPTSNMLVPSFNIFQHVGSKAVESGEVPDLPGTHLTAAKANEDRAASVRHCSQQSHENKQLR
jgi:hypothetical protein